jgi:hypothetical protein
LPTTGILQTDILRGAVIGVVLIATLLTLERLLVAIVVVGKPTRRATLRRVAWVNLHGPDTLCFGLMLKRAIPAISNSPA